MTRTAPFFTSSALSALLLSLGVTTAAAQEWDPETGTETTDPVADPMAAPAEPEPTPEPAADAEVAASSGAMSTAAGTMGLSFVVPTGGAPTVGLTYFLDPMTALRIDFGLAVTSIEGPTERDSDFGFSIEAGYRMYREVSGKVAVYLQPSLFISEATGEGDFAQLLTVGATGAFGAEYWLTEQWTLGGSIGAALLFSNEFSDISLTTGTSSLFTTFYW